MSSQTDNPSSYKALYRVCRPKRFSDVRGQEHITDILKKQIQIGKNAHAYLFCGTRGTGKTSTARILANALNCTHPVDGEPCGECDFCRAANADSLIDVVEIDAASNNGVEHVRELRESVMLSPLMGKFRVYIIDEVHMLSPQAFNALLKTLEEPPPHAVFILATTELKKVPVTIKSRCQFFSFKRIDMPVIVQTLKDIANGRGIEYEEKAIDNLASHADGALRDALSLMDQCLLSGSLTDANVRTALGLAESTMIRTLADAVIKQDVSAAISRLNAMLNGGVSAESIFRELILELSRALVKDVNNPQKRGMLLRSLDTLQEAQGMLKYTESANQFSVVTILKAASPAAAEDNKDLALRVKQLEQLVQELRRQMADITARTPAESAHPIDLPEIKPAKTGGAPKSVKSAVNAAAAAATVKKASGKTKKTVKASDEVLTADASYTNAQSGPDTTDYAQKPDAKSASDITKTDSKTGGTNAGFELQQVEDISTPWDDEPFNAETIPDALQKEAPEPVSTLSPPEPYTDSKEINETHADDAGNSVSASENTAPQDETAKSEVTNASQDTDDDTHNTIDSPADAPPAAISDDKLLGILIREVPVKDAAQACNVEVLRKVKRTGNLLTLYADEDDLYNVELLISSKYALEQVLTENLGEMPVIKLEAFTQTEEEIAAEEEFIRQATEVFKEYVGEENFFVEDED